MAVIGSLVSVDDGIVAINPHCTVIVRDRKAEDLLMHLLLPFGKLKKLNNSSHGKCHAVCILSICGIK